MKVLIGVDGSESAFAAVRHAAALLTADRDQVVFYYTPPELHGRHLQGDLRARARTALAHEVFEEARKHLPEAQRGTAQTILGEKAPRHGLLAAVDEARADLVVTGARGLGMMSKLLLGSVSSAVVRGAHVPVLVARSAQPPKRLLVSYDGSMCSQDAARFAAELAWPDDVQVAGLTVCEAMLAGAVPDWLEERARSADAEAMAQAWVREHEADKQQRLDDMTRFFQGFRGPFGSARMLVAEGNAAEQILQTVVTEAIDLVVLGAHGRTGLERLLIGSTSEKVMSHAPCSVLVVRPHRRM